MSDANEYRERAQRCVHSARTAPTKQQKIILLNMARAWIRLAKHVERYQALLGWQGLAASIHPEVGTDHAARSKFAGTLTTWSARALLLDAPLQNGAGVAS
jgi:hypothetical protein